MIYEEAKKISGELIELRREFHKIPELESCEFKTSELICKKRFFLQREMQSTV